MKNPFEFKNIKEGVKSTAKIVAMGTVLASGMVSENTATAQTIKPKIENSAEQGYEAKLNTLKSLVSKMRESPNSTFECRGPGFELVVDTKSIEIISREPTYKRWYIENGVIYIESEKGGKRLHSEITLGQEKSDKVAKDKIKEMEPKIDTVIYYLKGILKASK